MVGKSARTRARENAASHGASRHLLPGIVLLLAGTTFWGFFETRRVAAVQTAMLAADAADLGRREDPELPPLVEDGWPRPDAALRQRPDNAVWRYEFALLLEQQGRLDEAKEQARRSARLAPRSPKYKRLLEQIIQTGLSQGRNR